MQTFITKFLCAGALQKNSYLQFKISRQHKDLIMLSVSHALDDNQHIITKYANGDLWKSHRDIIGYVVNKHAEDTSTMQYSLLCERRRNTKLEKNNDLLIKNTFSYLGFILWPITYYSLYDI